MTVEVFVVDDTDTIVDQVGAFSSVSMAIKQNDISTWTLTAAIDPGALALMTSGYSVAIEQDGISLLTGPMLTTQRDRDESTNAVTISGVSDETILADRVAWPCTPAQQPDGSWLFADAGYYVSSGPAQTVMNDILLHNAGGGAFSTGAWAARQVAGLTAAPDMSIGGHVSANTRFETLLELFQGLASSGGVNFGITDRQFWVRQATDRTNEIVFGLEMGNVRALSYNVTGPTATHSIVAGSGQDVARMFWMDSNDSVATDWRRVEQFIDARDTSDPVALDQRGVQALTDGQVQTNLSVTPINAPGMQYGVDYAVGDSVTAIVDGIEIQDVLREVDITFDDNGQTVTPIIQSATTTGAASPLRIFDAIKEYERRLRHLERSL